MAKPAARPKATTATKARAVPARKPKAAPAPAPRRSAARSLWSGQLRLALVAVDVELFPATQPGARIAFHQLDRKTGKRIHYDKVVQDGGSVPADRLIKAVEIAKDSYVTFDAEELDAIKRVEKHIINLTQFVDASEIDPIWFDRPYYLAPAGDMAEEAYIILREALRKSRKVGLGQFVMRGRDYVASVKPCGRGLLLETLRFADEVRRSAPFFSMVPDDKPDPELLDLASELIGRKTAKFDAASFTDRYTADLQALIAEKTRTHKPIHVEETPKSPGGEVINLIDALRRSVGARK